MVEQNNRMIYEIETEDGQSVSLPADKLSSWKRGQELLKKQDPEALKRKQRLKDELLSKLKEQ